MGVGTACIRNLPTETVQSKAPIIQLDQSELLLTSTAREIKNLYHKAFLNRCMGVQFLGNFEGAGRNFTHHSKFP